MKDTHRKPMTEKVTWIEQGTPPKPKKKKSASTKEEAPKVEKKAEKPAAQKDEKAGKK